MQIGQLAYDILGQRLPLKVLRSAAGYYLGTFDDEEGPISRESAEYWATEAEAEAALASNGTGWTQRDHP